MEQSMERCTLTTIARAAHVSVSTVSYALRNHPKIPAATAQRIQQIARDLGYRSHPAVAALMSHIRAGRHALNNDSIAFVWVEAKRAAAASSFDRQTIAGARTRAAQLGYELEEFWLSEPGMTSRRLSDILKARGITGVVFSGCDSRTGVQLEMDWPAHAAAIIGNARWHPELHRAGHYHFMAMRRVLQELASRGYRRPAALLDQVVNERANRAWEAAFFAFHPTPARARLLLRTLPSGGAPGLREWLSRSKADVVIASKPAFLSGLRPSGGSRTSPGRVVLDLLEDAGALCGIDSGHAMIAGNAVDLVIGQLHRNERGIPSEPMKLLFEGRWVEGATLAPRSSVSVPLD
jgi:DNA-binding LacI/PurR family transcriptional regulator